MAEDPVAAFLAREDGAFDEEPAVDNQVPEPEENGAPPVVNGFQSPQNNDSGVDLAAQAEEPVVPPAPQQNGRGNSPASSIHSSQFSQQEEPESIKKWREEHLKAIKAKDEAEEKQKAELREQAKKELEAWQKQRENEIAERKKKNRITEEQLSKDLAASQSNGQGWSEIAKLVESPAKSAGKNSPDVSRMKALILEHKDEATA